MFTGRKSMTFSHNHITFYECDGSDGEYIYFTYRNTFSSEVNVKL